MLKRAREKQIEVIEKAIQHIYRKLPREEAIMIEAFVRQYYMSASPEDLIKFSVIDLYGSILSHWHFISQRQIGVGKVRVYNPQFEQHGWQSTHSVIEIIHPDMPFLVDSIRMELNRRGLNVHLILSCGGMLVKRDEAGNLQDVSFKSKKMKDAEAEAPLLIEFDRQSDADILEDIRCSVEVILGKVRLCVADWPTMLSNMEQAIETVKQGYTTIDAKETKEHVEFLKWLKDNHFTFLGYCKVDYRKEKNDIEWKLDSDSPLGILKLGVEGYFDKLHDLPEVAREEVLGKDIIIIGKANRSSKVHRPAYPDVIGIKEFDDEGQVVSQHCFIGLYTASAYNRSPQNIPLLRLKVKKICHAAGFDESSHDGKALINILETIPRDDMFQGTVEELTKIGLGILYLQERKRIKFFIRKDIFSHYYSCQVFVPRDRFNSDLRHDFSVILEEELGGTMADFSTRFSESILCRIHFIITIDPQNIKAYDEFAIEERLIEAGRTWEDNLKDALIDHFGEEEGNRLINKYCGSFSLGYQSNFIARTAVYDISHMETITNKNPLAMSFYRPLEEPEGNIRFKIFHQQSAIPLSDVIPMLEHMGLRIINERPHEIHGKDNLNIFINDFGMTHESGADLNVEAVKDVFQEAFYNIWNGNAESDGFNRLVLGAGISWQEVAMLRAYAKYLWQIGFTFSQNYIEDTLAKHNVIARLLVELFILRFDPTLPQDTKNERTNAIRLKIKNDLEAVENLDEDRILRRIVQVIMATIRTNFFQRDELGEPKNYISFKFDPSLIPEMPLPRPMFEIFVYSPRVEGVHLRGAKVARGGLRWSDRREDFRTEVLGLMKAQQVKNAVIVPLGAKGGFVPKNLPTHSREAMMEEGIACYQIFIKGLLDVTDNIENNKIIPPQNVVRYDEDDPYLVVAADKGTATFSDIANEVAQSYGFWLDDGFASGGSTGYDHKKMGITAKGAWESVKRHFLEMGHDTQTADFTVVGIGDMAGDVFGNGMLLSKHIRLIAAFNHMHIFIDPNPDAQNSYIERQRLFNLPRSSWTDYNAELISEGGGIFERSAKSINISPQMKSILGIHQDKLIPNDLIRAILKAKVDLLWNGGIGTYIKSQLEHNSDVGDRANDAVRVNGADLKCKVIGEGGNLGCTQLGRIEYALHSGRLNTDAIDNSAGVDCSDHEVNIKILLNAVVSNGDLTLKQRNQLLESMTDEVSELVLDNNKNQTRALSLALLQPAKNINMYSRLIDFLEKEAKLDRDIEFLPDQEMLMTRQQNKQGLTRPELSVLFAYAKTWLKEELLNSDLPEDVQIAEIAQTAFPKVLKEKYAEQMDQHRLKREIIVMQLANLTINNMGPNFVPRLQDETGASAPEIIRAYMVARDVFSEPLYQREIEGLGFSIESEIQLGLLFEFNRLIRRATRWLLRHARSGLELSTVSTDFKQGVEKVAKQIRPNLKAQAKEYLETLANEYVEKNVPTELAYKSASFGILSSALDIVEASMTHRLPLEHVVATYFSIGARLELGWFREQIKLHPVVSHWDAMARATFRDDLDKQQRNLTISILLMEGEVSDIEAKIDAWIVHHKSLVERFRQLVAELKAQPTRNFTMYSVALRELLDLSLASKAA